METRLDKQAKQLYQKVKKLIPIFFAAQDKRGLEITLPVEFEQEFFDLIDKVNFILMEDNDNFYGYFLIQMDRKIRLDMSSPTGVNFKGTKYIIYFNPLIFLSLTIKQMEHAIKHEILHILSLHLLRANNLMRNYSKIAINTAMDIVVNKYLGEHPPFATTLERINKTYHLDLKPHASFEYYVEKLKEVMPVKELDKHKIATEYDVATTHDIWQESSDIDTKTIMEFTEKAIKTAERSEMPTYLKHLISEIHNGEGELPWNIYLNRLMGSIESNYKKIITRRNRRQPDRLDLRGQLRNHKANIIVALDISGSISNEEFKQAIHEVLSIVKNRNHEITIVECDDAVRRAYKVKSEKDIKDRINSRGYTRYNPVFEYANRRKVNLLIYFTDGKGEDRLKVVPKGYKILWVISGQGEGLSLKKPYGAIKRLSNIKTKDSGLDIGEVEKGGFSMNHQEGIV